MLDLIENAGEMINDGRIMEFIKLLLTRLNVFM